MNEDTGVSQKNQFLSGEGNEWYERNKWNISAAIKNDPILKAIEHCVIRPIRVLEIGCADGWRLAEIERRYGCTTHGIDPSEKAINAGQREYPNVQLSVGTADKLPDMEPVDLIIFGFCLYLCDPQDLFKIAMECDRLLKDKGQIIIYDFNPPIGHYRNHYRYKSGIYSYKMNYSKLFLWHPSYCMVYQNTFHHQSKSPTDFSPDDMVSVQIIRKENMLLTAERRECNF